MNRGLLGELKRLAKETARSLPEPALYRDNAEDVSFSWEIFFNHPLLLKLQDDVLQFLYDDFMFGIEHAKKAAQDAGLLVLLQTAGQPEEERRRLSVLAQVAGMLCGLERGDGLDNTDGRLTETAGHVLRSCRLKDGEADRVLWALGHIRSADAPPDREVGVLADALYDAVHFRYGPDILATSLWMHCDYAEATPQALRLCLAGEMQALADNAPGFRTGTGRAHGPELLAQGKTVLSAVISLLEDM